MKKKQMAPALSRMLLAACLGMGLLSIFQNCSKVNFAADDKTLVQGAISPTETSTPTTSSSSTDTTSGATSDLGICVLTCAQVSDDVHAFSQGQSCQNPTTTTPTCQLEQDGSGAAVTSIVQSVSNSDSTPKTACMSKQACANISTYLSSGKLILMKTSNNQVSTQNTTIFQPVAHSDDCQEILTDSEVATQLGE